MAFTNRTHQTKLRQWNQLLYVKQTPYSCFRCTIRISFFCPFAIRIRPFSMLNIFSRKCVHTCEFLISKHKSSGVDELPIWQGSASKRWPNPNRGTWYSVSHYTRVYEININILPTKEENPWQTTTNVDSRLCDTFLSQQQAYKHQASGTYENISYTNTQTNEENKI